jgi:hypothetical protein
LRIKRLLITLLAVLPLLFAALPNTAYASADITIIELSNAAEHLDHQTVVFDCEVVGDIIGSGDGKYWITANDGTASISVFITADSRNTIVSLGNYQQQGTLLEVTGEFNLACDQHDGLSDVHAYSTRVLDPGSSTEHPANFAMLGAGGLLIVAGVGLIALYSILRQRKF